MKEAFTYDVAEFTKGRFQQVHARAIQEVPLTIYLNGQEVVTLLCTGKNPKFLAVGFLKSAGSNKPTIFLLNLTETTKNLKHAV